MAFPVDAEDRAVGVDGGQGIVPGVVALLVETDGQHNTEFFCQCFEMRNSFIYIRLAGDIVELGLFLLAEIRRFKELLQQDDLRTSSRRLPDQPFGVPDIFIDGIGAAHLRCRDGDHSHNITSCLNQGGHGNPPLRVMRDAEDGVPYVYDCVVGAALLGGPPAT